MKTNMDDSRISDVSELLAFIKGLGKIEIKLDEDIGEKYSLIERTVKKFKYHSLPKHTKKAVLIYTHLTQVCNGSSGVGLKVIG